MGILVARVKISPTGPGLNASTFEPLISDILPVGSKIRQIKEEPLAFGVFTIFADIEFEDNPGALDVVEECLNKLEQVSELETIAVSNTSTSTGEV
jgi:elongation factor 1-beta|tara:strand:+ start:2419 stop:2706 length:288 start_codon:yes stop_codon:yes gene_type:complete